MITIFHQEYNWITTKWNMCSFLMQVKYVVEFEKTLEKMLELYRVDLITCLIYYLKVDSSNGDPTEMQNSDQDEDILESGGAYIV